MSQRQVQDQDRNQDQDQDDSLIEAFRGPDGGQSTGILVKDNGTQLKNLNHKKKSLPPFSRVDSNNATVLDNFPYNLVMKVTTSEPRDVLQSERTCLTFIRFSTALFFTALGIILGFKLDTSGKTPNSTPDKGNPIFSHSKFSKAASFILLVLALFVLILSAVNYFITIHRYAKRKIETYNFNNLTTVICMTVIVLTLGVINIVMIIEGYIEDR